MKFTLMFCAVLGISSAVKVRTEPKDKREVSFGYAAVSGAGPVPAYPVQYPAYSPEEANAISIGAGYSVGAPKDNYQYSDNEAPKLPPITLQASQLSQGLVSSDLSQLMNQISQGLSSGAIALPSHGNQEAQAQLTYGSPKLQYSVQEAGLPSVPAYAAGTKGLSSFGSTGPVLFNPNPSDPNSGNIQPSHVQFASPAAGHAYSAPSVLPLGSSIQSHSGIALLTSHPTRESAQSSGQSLGGHSLKGLKGYSGYLPGKLSFKPSTYLNHGDASHGLASLGQYAVPSFSLHSLSGGHGGHGLSLGSTGHSATFGSTLGGAPKYVTGQKSEVFGQTYGPGGGAPGAQLSSASGSFSAPSSPLFSDHSNSGIHAASFHSPQYYISSGKYPIGASPYKPPASGHSSLSARSTKPKYSSSRYSAPYRAADTHGAYSENTYNTIKYSEEIKPHYRAQ